MKVGRRPGTANNATPEGSPWTMPRQPELDKWMLWFGLVSGVDWLKDSQFFFEETNNSQLSKRSEVLGRLGWFRLASQPTNGGVQMI